MKKVLIIPFLFISLLSLSQDNIDVSGNKYHLYGPNSTWSQYLQVGGNGRVTSNASVVATNGNLHLDSKEGHSLYLNHYSRGNTYLNPQGGFVGVGTSSPGKPLHISSSIEHHQLRLQGTNNKHSWIQFYPSGSGVLNWQMGASTNGFSVYDLANSKYRLTIANSGNVGIGTTSPQTPLEVNGDMSIKNLGGTIMRTGIFGASTAHSGTSGKWIKMGEMILNGDWGDANLTLDFYPWNARHGDSRQQINISIRNNTAGIEGSYDINLITFYGQQKSINDVKLVHTSGSGVSYNSVSIWIQMATSHVYNVPFKAYYSGNIDLEFTNQPYHSSITESGTVYEVNSSYGMYGSQFEVNGTIRSKEVKVEASPWPDYVFEENYDLPSIESIEKFIQSNKHLPEVPSAAEVEAEGLKLGEMNTLLLRKIEELTLYTIAQEKKLKKVDLLEKENSELRRENDELNSRIEAQSSELRAFKRELINRIENLENNN